VPPRALPQRHQCFHRWTVIPDVSGRLIASVTQPSYGGLVVNDPLADQEDRQHIHNYTASVRLPYHHVAALSHDNYDGAAEGLFVSDEWAIPSLMVWCDRHTADGVTLSSTSDLPFAQLVLCTAPNGTAGAIAAGTVAYAFRVFVPLLITTGTSAQRPLHAPRAGPSTPRATV
jgi:hypothetical protein